MNQQEFTLNYLQLLSLIEKAFLRLPTLVEAERLTSELLALGEVQQKQNQVADEPQRIITKLDEIKSLLEAKASTEPPTEWVSVKEFAKLIDRSEWYVCEKFCKAGKVRCRKLDPMNSRSEWRILRSEARRFFEQGFKATVQVHDG